jgi:hypothetical protein
MLAEGLVAQLEQLPDDDERRRRPVAPHGGVESRYAEDRDRDGVTIPDS